MKKRIFIILLCCVFSVNAQEENYRIKKITSNTKYQDFGVSYFGDSIVVFSSTRKKKFQKRKIWKGNQQPYLDLYKGVLDKEGDITKVKRFSKRLNTQYHESNATFTKDLKTVYFNRNNYINRKIKKDSTGVVLIQLYRAKLAANGEWGDIQPMPFNNDNYQTGHPVLNKNEDKLYFVSDMPGSYGLTDIYVVDIHEDGSYGTPKNLGKTINTSKKELFPYVDDNDVLYYSSEGFTDSKGGLDVYKIQLGEAVKENKPKNLGTPINSDKDDFSFIKQKGKDVGHLSSNRKGGKGDDDIYAFEALLKNCVSESCITLDLRDSEGLRNDNIIYTWEMGDGNKAFGNYITYCYDKPGTYIAKLTTKDLTSGFIEENVETIEIEINSSKGSYAQFVIEENYELGTPVKFDAKLLTVGTGKIISYSWDLGDASELRDRANFEHQYVKAGTYEVKLKVLVDNGHDGICEYTTVQSVLMSKKKVELPPPALTITAPIYKIDISNNTNLNLYQLKVVVTDRKTKMPLPLTSVKIIDYEDRLWYSLKTNKEGFVFVEVDRNVDYKIRVSKEMYGEVIKDHTTLDRTETEYSIVYAELGVYIKPIYFDFDKSNIRNEITTRAELDKVISIMKKYPDMIVEMGSHTDARGTDAYNMKLSQRRAQASLNYITSRGISPNRISAKGYGETQLVNACKSGVACDEETHQLNRRTTFKIIKF